MNRILIILFLTFNFCAFGQTQHEMHKEASEGYKKSDVELNNVYQKILTEERTEKLRIWLKGIEEGDICSGSVKTN